MVTIPYVVKSLAPTSLMWTSECGFLVLLLHYTSAYAKFNLSSILWLRFISFQCHSIIPLYTFSFTKLLNLNWQFNIIQFLYLDYRLSAISNYLTIPTICWYFRCTHFDYCNWCIITKTSTFYCYRLKCETQRGLVLCVGKNRFIIVLQLKQIWFQ